MNLRIEPRFKTEANVGLELLRRKGDPLPGRIIDVSGVGFRLSVKQALAVGEPLQINAGDCHVLAMVRYCVPVENGYSVGVERIDAWLPEDKAAPSGKAPQQETASVLGRPKLKGHLGLLQTLALRDLFSKQTSAKSQRALVLGGIAAAIGLSVLVVCFLRHIP